MSDAEPGNDQLFLLETYRRTLQHLLRQAAHYGGERVAPPAVFNGIFEAREQIRQLKANLLAQGIAIDDLPGDMPPDGEPALSSIESPKQQDIVQHITIGGNASVGQIVGKQITYNYYYPKPDAPYDRNRQAMIQKVKTIWITGLLERSLAREARLELGLVEMPGKVDMPLHALVQELAEPSHPLPRGAKMIDVFAAFGGSLLILGAPGVGKTTLVLELTRDLLVLAEQTKEHPIPVVFNLSSWAQHRQTLAEWLIHELRTKYDVPRRVAQEWVENDALLPLLDGLDEVRPDARTDCVEAINAFRSMHGLVPLAICSRLTDYDALRNRLRLQGAVQVLPLSPDQIAEYLAHGGAKSDRIRDALRQDMTLRDLVVTPLMLNIMVLAYADAPVEVAHAQVPPDVRREELFDRYVKRMFARRSHPGQLTRDKAIEWLGWLARQMHEHSQTIFYLEWLQPDWLPSHLRCWYNRLVPLAIGLVVGVLVGAFSTMPLGVVWGVAAALGSILGADLDRSGAEWPWRRRLAWGALVGVGVAVVGGALTGIFIQGAAGLFERLVLGGIVGAAAALPTALSMTLLIRPVHALVTLLSRHMSPDIGAGFGVGASVGLSACIGYGVVIGGLLLAVGLRFEPVVANPIIMNGLGLGLGSGLAAGLAGRVRIAEQLSWSWRAGLSIGCVTGFGVALLYEWPEGVREGVRAGLVLALVAGITGRELNAKARLVPNQGIWRSARNALWGIVIGALAAICLTILRYVEWAPDRSAVGTGVFVALIWAFRGGLTACLQHIIMRGLLIRSGVTPFHFVRFLDEATARILLRRVGGGFIFVHRSLLDYFAARSPSTPIE